MGLVGSLSGAFGGLATPFVPGGATTQVQPNSSWFAQNQPGGGGATTQPVTPPGGTSSRPVSGGSSSGADANTLIQQFQQTHPVGAPGSSVQDLVAFLQQNGVNAQVATHAGGTQLSGDKIVLPDSSVVDLISNEGGSNQAWSNTPDGYFVNGQPSTTPASVGLTPPPPDGSGGSGMNGLSASQLPGGTQNGLQPGLGYVLPTAQQALQSPGLQFALQQGEQGIERNAAASGLLRSGGTLKSLANFDEGTALQGYGNLVNQQLAANQYNTGSLFNLANIGENAAAQTGAFGQNYAAGAGNSLSNIGNSQAAGAIAQGNALTGAANGGANALNTYLLSRYLQGSGGGGLNLPQNTGTFSAPSDSAGL